VSITAIVLAGQRPGIDPLAQAFATDLKALVPVGGEPMVRRPVRALSNSPSVGRIIVLAQQAERIADALTMEDVEVRESQGTIAETILGLCADPATAWPLLVTTADHALLEPAMIEEFCAAAERSDIAIGLVQRETLLQRLPQTKRTWLPFRGEAVTGANLFFLRSAAVAPAVELWRSVEQDRKKAWRLISLLGSFLLAMALLRQLGLDEVMARAGQKLRLDIKAVRLTNPLAGVDVDKVEDHILVEAILAGRA
jgi:GTP:adenosylcobinamide-phosphate guanylyltransferase